MANKFEQYVAHAPSIQSIINYFYNFSGIKPTHVAEAQILLDSDNPYALAALQTLVSNGQIKGNLDTLKTKTELKEVELSLVKQSVLEAWQLKRIQTQHTK